VPEVPLIRVERLIGKPPWQMSSKPSIPVGSFCTCISGLAGAVLVGLGSCIDGEG
jgi:hypothetical protein